MSTTDSIDYRVGRGQYIEEIYCDQRIIDSSNSHRLDERLSDKEWAWILLKAVPIKIN
jgi:hypothetical protein